MAWFIALLVVGSVFSMNARASQRDDSLSKPDLYVLTAQIDTKVLARGETPNSREARLLAKLATDRSGGFYGKIRTRVLFAEQASRENILGGFTWLKTNMKDQDVALVFIAGHGTYDERHHLYTYHPVGGPIKGIEFRQAFNGIPGRKVLLLQTCHASGVLETPKGELPFRKTMVICACDDDEEATRLMGYVIVNGFAKMAASSDGIVTTQSLAQWIELRVPLISKGKQHVQISRPPLFTDFPLASKGELVDPNMTGRF
ncbi:MAG TPA: caspase family protein [Opitutaceae bacterium]|jgi:hypothetical protein